jgi:DNA-binding IclR family transcriptional regulator
MTISASVDTPELGGAIERTLRVLQAVADQGEFSPADIAREVGLPTSTVYRLMQSLSAMNFVEKAGHGSYRVGRQFLRIASLIVDQFDYEALAQPFLAELAERFEETVAFALYLPRDYAFTIIHSISAKHPLQYVVTKYTHRTMIGGALGRSMLPFLPEKDVLEAIARQSPAEQAAPPMTLADLKKEAEAIRGDGCFVATSPNAFGTNGTAAPVFNARGQLLGSLGVTVPIVRYDPALQPEISAAIVKAARELSAILGFRADAPRKSRAAAA